MAMAAAGDPLSREAVSLALSGAAAAYARAGDLDRATLLRLAEVFGERLLGAAFEVVESGAVRRLVAKDSRRTVIQVHAVCFIRDSFDFLEKLRDTL